MTDTAASHAQTRTTAAVNTKIVAAPPDPDDSAMKLPANTTPVMRETMPSPRPSVAREPCAQHEARRDQADETEPATAKWARPCQLTSPIPAGVPGGNPSDGSARKIPAHDETGAVGPEQTRRPRRQPARPQRAAHADGRRDRHRPGDRKLAI